MAIGWASGPTDPFGIKNHVADGRGVTTSPYLQTNFVKTGSGADAVRNPKT